MSMRLPSLIAHRGASAYAPENTLAAFAKAKALGAKMIEFDVMLSADDVAVVIHDTNLLRTTNGRGRVANKSLAFLQGLDAGSWFAPEFGKETIPTLEQVLIWAADNAMQLNIEVKPTPGRCEVTAKKVRETIAKVWPKDKQELLLSSFSLTALKQLRQDDLKLTLGLLMTRVRRDWQSLAKQLACFSVHIDQTRINERFATQVKDAGLQLLAYTVNDNQRAQQLFQLGVDSVFSDYPDKIQAQL